MLCTGLDFLGLYALTAPQLDFIGYDTATACVSVFMHVCVFVCVYMFVSFVSFVGFRFAILGLLPHN